MSQASTRRSFLRSSLLGASVLLARLGSPSSALADPLPSGELSLYNTHTDERLEVTYRDRGGRYDDTALRALDRILRCHYDGEVAKMDVRVIEILDLVATRLGGGHEIEIISGFRSQAYNDWLIKHGGGGVAQHSLHMVAKAIDVRLKGVPLDRLHRAALDLRLGGVGYYPRSDFVHLDSGRVRTW